ncbi:MAG: hypothetical protein JWM47_1201 [Acidimicrobiales bacterium]|nr:hypothetical protein [Acidimicrobiales bacterium]
MTKHIAQTGSAHGTTKKLAVAALTFLAAGAALAAPASADDVVSSHGPTEVAVSRTVTASDTLSPAVQDPGESAASRTVTASDTLYPSVQDPAGSTSGSSSSDDLGALQTKQQLGF